MAQEVSDRKKAWQKRAADYGKITVAAFLYAMAVSLFLDPNTLAPGGVTGIAVILSGIFGWETGTLVLLINVPILLLGLWKFGLRFSISTIYSTVVTSAFINLLGHLGPVTTDRFLAASAGGALMAAGLGMTMKAGATTGGMDIIVKLLRLKYPHRKTGYFFLLTDLAVVSLSAVAFRDMDVALYAGLTVVINSLLLDVVLYGRDGAKMIFVISECCERITDRLLTELEVGATWLHGAGAFTGTSRKVILCVMRKNLSPRAETIIREEDPEAFLIITNATEIYGEGYKDLGGKLL